MLIVPYLNYAYIEAHLLPNNASGANFKERPAIALMFRK